MSSSPFFIFGLHAVESLLQNKPDRIQVLKVVRERDDQKIKSILRLAEQKQIALEFLSRPVMDKFANRENHQGVIALCYPPKIYDETDLENILAQNPKPLLLILDGIQDPHNLGACLRSADAANVAAVIAPKDNSVGLTPTVAKVSSGASETVPFVQVTNLARTLDYLKEKGIWIFGATEEADQFYFASDLKGATALVLGAEGRGLRRLTKEHCDFLIKIPMLGSVSSLNVSVATGILLFEAVRQRN